MVSCADRIIEGLSRDPKGIATSLSSIISSVAVMETMEINMDKTRRLYITLLEIVKHYPEKYKDFVAIFRGHGGMYTDLLEMLEIKGVILALS